MAEPLLSGVPIDDVPLSATQCGSESHTRADPIAIVGIACRLPGNVACPADLWELLVNERSGHCDIPRTRFNADGFFHPDSNRPGSLPSRGGYFIQDDVRKFDNQFFGINNLEAKFLDPQQRQLLEVAYECLENGGQSLKDVSGSKTGCFVANFTNDYSLMQFKDAEYSSHYSGTGAAASILANRLNHIFNLKGPSLVVDTACSSSLYALHLACNAIRNEDCRAAIVASANLIQSPEQHLQAVKAGILSPDSTCHTYDSSANGYGRAEGVCALFVKRLSDAIADRDPIRAIIRGTALNSNGKTTGISLPDAAMQASVIAQAYRQAGLSPQDTSYVEAHGTGTPVGDPIEIEGLAKAFRPKCLGDSNTLQVGSVKTNLGHSEGASGLTSIIKVVLALEKKIIPPTIGIKSINPRVVKYSDRVTIVEKPQPWPDRPVYRAGVNSFGFGGANGHVILEDSSLLLPRKRTGELEAHSFKYLLPLSAKSQESLDKVTQMISQYCTSKQPDLPDLSYTLGCRRSIHSQKGFLLAYIEASKIKIYKPPASDLLSTPRASQDSSLAFVFTGQGAQWPQMGSGLLERFPRFKQSIAQLDAVLQDEPNPPEWTFIELLQGSKHWDTHRAVISQPLCTAVQIGLVDLLSSWSLRPDFVIGHSSGEIAAAYCTGALTAKEAILVAYYRGVIVATWSQPGQMAAVGLDPDSVYEEIGALSLKDHVCVACINSRENVTVSGDSDEVDRLLQHFKKRQTFVRPLKTDGKAYHSHHMQSIGEAYSAILDRVITSQRARDSSQKSHMISSVTKSFVGLVELRSPRYWRRNLESPVQFESAMTTLAVRFQGVIVEVGPHPALQLPVKQTLSRATDFDHLYMPTLNRQESSTSALLSLAGNLFTRGFEIDIASVNQLSGESVITDLPAYPWNHDAILWHESSLSHDYRIRPHPRHYILGSRLPGHSDQDWSWRNILRVRDTPWLSDHKVSEVTILPAAAFINAAVEALRQRCNLAFQGGVISITTMAISKALVLPQDDVGIETFTSLRPKALSSSTRSATKFNFEFNSRSGKASTLHAYGTICFKEHQRLQFTERHCAKKSTSLVSAQNWYDRLKTAGLDFGSSFRTISEVRVWAADDYLGTGVDTSVALQDSQTSDQSTKEDLVHLCLIDSLLQSSIISNAEGQLSAVRARVPVTLEEVLIHTPTDSPSGGQVQAKSFHQGAGASMNSATLYGSLDRPIVQMRGLRLVEYANTQHKIAKERRRALLRILWRPSVSLLQHSEESAFERFISQEVSRTPPSEQPRHIIALKALLETVIHDDAKQRVHLLLSPGQQQIEQAVNNACSDIDGLRRIQSITAVQLVHIDQPDRAKLFITSNSGEQSTAVELTGQEFDILITDKTDAGAALLDERVSPGLRDGALLVTITRSSSTTAMKTKGVLGSFSSLLNTKYFDGCEGYELRLFRYVKATQVPETLPAQQSIYLITAAEAEQHDIQIKSELQNGICSQITQIPLSMLSKHDLPHGCTVVCTAEISRPSLLASLSESEFACVQRLTEAAQHIFWITTGSSMDSTNPEGCLVLGLARALMLEQPASKFFVIGCERNENSLQISTSAKAIAKVVGLGLTGVELDFELALLNGLLYSSRFSPDAKYNSEFNTKQSREPLRASPQQDHQHQLTCDRPGEIGSLFWDEQYEPTTSHHRGSLEIKVDRYSLNFKDLAIAVGNFSVRDGKSSLECLGVVTKSLAIDSDLQSGDQVLVMAPQKMRTHQSIPEWACVKVSQNEDTDIVTLPLVFSTAIYALDRRAQIQEGESVLIHCGAGGLGQASIQIAQLHQATIYATVGTQEKHDFLVSEYGLDPAHIFSSRDSGFAERILEITQGEGVDIAVNCLTGDLLHETIRCCSQFGRFIEVGRRDIYEFGQLEMLPFKKNISVIPFDLTDLFYSRQWRHNMIWKGLLQQTVDLFRAGKIRLIKPIKTVGMSSVVEGFQALASPKRIGKVVVDLRSRNGQLSMIRPVQFRTKLNPNKHYLMVGCLGGLGRSIAQWMVDRGARRFTFLNPSGIDKPHAAQTIRALEERGAQALVVRGRVDSQADVNNAVSQTCGPIGGVIQAAMGLSEALFSSMTSEQWHKAVGPKLKGSWNLHRALQQHETTIDFFILTSSISGSVGTATESNYCAANSFEDAFARYRRSKGLKAVSIGFGMISEVGYLHEHPDIEKLLLRKGIHPINEAELKQIVDMAIAWESQKSSYLCQGDGHILTGLELVGLDAQRQDGFEGHSHVLDDPRSSLLAFNFALQSKQNPAASQQNQDLQELLERADKEILVKEVGSIVTKKIANLVLVADGQLSNETRLGEFGMDSMLAAEFRGHIFHLLFVDVPFMMILGASTTVQDLVTLVVDAVLDRRTSGRQS